MDLSTLTWAPATEPVPIEPIRVDGMAYAKIIAGMMNVGYFRERPTADGGSERVIVAKLVFPGDPSTVNRAIIVTQAGLAGAMREQVEPIAPTCSGRATGGSNTAGGLCDDVGACHRTPMGRADRLAGAF